MLRTVQGAPPTDRAVRESTWYFTVLRPPSRSTLNCSWEGKGERACAQDFVGTSYPLMPHDLIIRDPVTPLKRGGKLRAAPHSKQESRDFSVD